MTDTASTSEYATLLWSFILVVVTTWSTFPLANAQTIAPTSATDAWSWRATLYGWLAGGHAGTDFDVNGGDRIHTDTDSGSYLSNLKFAAMGTVEARKGPWSFLGDAIYLNFGKLKSDMRSIDGPGGIVVPLTSNVRTKLEGFAGALEGGYSLMQTSSASLDLVAGARYMQIKTQLDWEFTGPLGGLPGQGSVAVTKDIWEGVVAYSFHDVRPIDDLAFSGPIFGIGFKF